MTKKYAGVVLDYGHGGIIDGVYQTPISKQYKFTDHDGFWIGEGVTNRKTCAYLIQYCLDAGIRVWDSVAKTEWTYAPHWMELEQSNTSLASRVTYANGPETRHAILLSVHSNAIGSSIEGPSLPARGVSMYTSVGQTASDVIADSLYESFTKIVGDDLCIRPGNWEDGDRDHEANFYMLRKTYGPAVCGEVGFFTNINDARFLDSEVGQQKIARAYLEGVLPFLETAPKTCS